jgi:four helix bundle protein
MDNDPKYKNDLEERGARFAKRVRSFVRSVPKDVVTIEDGRQIVRSSGSVGANYIETNEALSKKDFAMRIKICRKEAKETRYWLGMYDNLSPLLQKERDTLIQESTEFIIIFSSILTRL